jgi:hypothetical protein
VPFSFSSLEEGGFSCQELVMRVKTETLVDANGSAVVFKDIQESISPVNTIFSSASLSDTDIALPNCKKRGS